jgi:hypothetical protein
MSENAFKRCAPAVGNNLRKCGTVTQCQVAPMVSGDLTTAFMKTSADFRVMGALFHHDFELKMCEATQNGLYELFMSQKVNMRRTMQSKHRTDGTLEIAPFVLGRRYSPINDAYWDVLSGTAGVGSDWVITVGSSGNVPLSGDPDGVANTSKGEGSSAGCTTFPVGLRVWIQGVSQGGHATRTQWTVKSTALNVAGTIATLILTDGNGGSKLDPDKLAHPKAGLLVRGTPNVNDFEKWCHESPTYRNWNDFPFFTETIRNTTCKSSQFDKWRELVMLDNQLYKEYFYLPEIEENKQIMADWQKRIVNTMFWGTASSAYQTAALYDNLPEIDSYDPTSDGLDAGLGVDGGTCIGRKADAEGIYQQLAECLRIVDLGGGTLHLLSVFDELYNMMRVRESAGHKTPKIFDILMDSVQAEMWSQAMLKYYNARSDGMARLNIDGEGYSTAKQANFGFSYRSFKLFWPAGVVINIISHDYFDDWITAAYANGLRTSTNLAETLANTARVAWILDLPGIYPGILASNHVTADTGALKNLAQLYPAYGCVMKVHTKQTELWSMTWTVVVECPKGNLIIEGIGAALPNYSTKDTFSYGAEGTLVEPYSTTTNA